MPQYSKTILIGHSIGGLLTRKAYIVACGEIANAPFETDIELREQKEWAPFVERVILLAAINRGWSISHHLSISNTITYRLGVLLGGLLSLFGRKLLILQARRGAPFITQLRIQSITLNNKRSW